MARTETRPEIHEQDLSLTFAALADPTRRSILGRLAEGEATVNELAEPFAISQQAVSRHIKVLEQAGLISRRRAAQARPCRLEPEHLDTAAAWIAEHRRLWSERYDRLDEHLANLRGANPDDTNHPDGRDPDGCKPDGCKPDDPRQEIKP